MIDPISASPVRPITPASLPAARSSESGDSAGETFATQLRRQLEQVSDMQAGAERGIQDLLTGRTDNITAVLTATRKAEVAFTLLMEIRNKLVDAYTELRQLRV